jgi:hypothetical protein
MTGGPVMAALIWPLMVAVVASTIASRRNWQQLAATFSVSLIGAYSGAAAGGLALANLSSGESGVAWETIGIATGAVIGALAFLVAYRRLIEPVSLSEMAPKSK